MINFIFCYSQDTTFAKVFYETNNNLTSERAVDNYKLGFTICGFRNTESMIINSDSLGNILWANSLYQYDNQSKFEDIITTKDSCFIVSGILESINNQKTYIICAKYNQLGDTQWVHSFDYPNNNFSFINRTRVVETKDSCYLITWSLPNNNQIMLVKLNSDGNIIWEKIHENNNQFLVNTIQTDEDSCIYLAGSFNQNDGVLLKLNAFGNILWAKKYDEKAFIDMVIVNNNLFLL